LKSLNVEKNILLQKQTGNFDVNFDCDYKSNSDFYQFLWVLAHLSGWLCNIVG